MRIASRYNLCNDFDYVKVLCTPVLASPQELTEVRNEKVRVVPQGIGELIFVDVFHQRNRFVTWT